MTELTLETLREELARELAPIRAQLDALAPVRDGMPIVSRALTVLQDHVREMRDDLDKLVVIVRRMRDEADVTGGILMRLERRLERLEEERRP